MFQPNNQIRYLIEYDMTPRFHDIIKFNILFTYSNHWSWNMSNHKFLIINTEPRLHRPHAHTVFNNKNSTKFFSENFFPNNFTLYCFIVKKKKKKKYIDTFGSLFFYQTQWCSCLTKLGC